jgi:prepilin-type N-terminal cleavage/methylation domain-containing protein
MEKYSALRKKTLIKQKSFTLIEFVIVIGLVGILSAASSVYIVDVINSWRYASFRNEVVWRARIALIRMDREIRMAKSITTAQNSTITFTVTDGILLTADSNDDTVTYTYNAGSHSLERTLNGTMAILSQNVYDLTFSYYDSSGAITTDPDQIKLIGFLLEVRSGTSANAQVKKLSLKVYPRNL